MSRGLARLLKSGFSRDRLRLAVVELTMRVDVQPASRIGVLVALLEAETLSIRPDASIQSDPPDCLLIIDSNTGTTNNPVAEEEIELFRPRLHWIPLKE
jgi:hypothetical protein